MQPAKTYRCISYDLEVQAQIVKNVCCSRILHISNDAASAVDREIKLDAPSPFGR